MSRRMRSFGSFSLVAILTLATISIIPSTLTPAFAAEVAADIVSGASSMTTEAFSPYPININVGDTVTWTNRDSQPHTVTSGTAAEGPDGNFDSSPDFDPIMAPQATFSHTFEEAGEFPYYCGLHPNQVGTVIVQSGSETIRLTVRTDESSYETGDDITITGKLTISGGTVSQPLRIQILDPQGNRDRVDQFDVAEDGSYSYSFPAGGTMDTDGEYTVLVSYRTTDEETTFEFTSTGEEIWRTIQASIGGQNHPIQYMISGSGNRLVSVTGDVETISLLAALSTQSEGTLSLRFDQATFDADEEFIAFANEVLAIVEDTGEGSTNEIHIDFEAGTIQIELLGDKIVDTHTSGPQQELTVSTDSNSYAAGSNVRITARVYGETISNQNVAISVSNPAGASVISRTVTTNGNGYASLLFKIADDSRAGTYRVVTTALIDGLRLEAVTEFTVGSSLSGISIVSVQATDQQGNAVSSFTRGSLGFVKVVVSSESQTTSLVTVNIFDSDLTSLGVGSLKTTLGSGSSEMVLSFFIPNEAESGESEIYANVFSDWPATGGVPLTGESSIQVQIT